MAQLRRAVRAGLADLPPGSVVLVACSGGADSLALAAAVAHEGPRAGLRAAAATVDHGLQPGSAARAARVAGVLQALGLGPVAVRRAAVDGPGGPESAARDARYSCLHAEAGAVGAAAILLGHTRDDQAETVLLGLARGSGARSLAGMAAVNGLLRRPLLGCDRATTRAACAALGLDPWDDPHNEDPVFSRARVRHRVLPGLEAELGPGVAAALARSAALLRDDADALDGWAATVRERVTGPDGGLDAVVLATLPAAVRRRVLRLAALGAGSPPTSLTAGHAYELDRLVVDWHGQGPLSLPGGVEAARRCGKLCLSRAAAAG